MARIQFEGRTVDLDTLRLSSGDEQERALVVLKGPAEAQALMGFEEDTIRMKALVVLVEDQIKVSEEGLVGVRALMMSKEDPINMQAVEFPIIARTSIESPENFMTAMTKILMIARTGSDEGLGFKQSENRPQSTLASLEKASAQRKRQKYHVNHKPPRIENLS